MANGLTAGNLIAWSPPSLETQGRVVCGLLPCFSFPVRLAGCAQLSFGEISFDLLSCETGSWQMSELHHDVCARTSRLSHCSVPFTVLRCFSCLDQLKRQDVSHTEGPQIQSALQ